MQQKIPKIIHQTWLNGQVPLAMRGMQQTWRQHHPDWEYRLWTDEDNRRFLQQYYDWFVPTYDAYPEPIMRADAVRYFILYHYGGVYVDLDFECLRPIEKLLSEHSLVLGLEPEAHHQTEKQQMQQRGFQRIVCNAFMASTREHEFWSHVFEVLMENAEESTVLDVAGPYMLTRAVDSYEQAEQLTLLPPALIYPMTNKEAELGRWEDVAFQQQCAKTAFAVHHWFSSWAPSNQRQLWDAQEAQLCREESEQAPELPEACPVNLLLQKQTVLAGNFFLKNYQNLLPRLNEQPQVSCLMVTKNRPALARCAITCFQKQTYTRRELIIVDDSPGEGLATYVRELKDPRIRHIWLQDQQQTLGELRNLAVSLAEGEFIAQWDDDDLSHPQRLAIQMAALSSLDTDACFLARETLWWPGRGELKISTQKMWEGSSVCRKSKLAAYPSLRKGEDVPVIAKMFSENRIALLDLPLLYFYVFHSNNTWDIEHFQAQWRIGSDRLLADEYQRQLRALDRLMPLSDYLNALGLALD